MKDAEFKKQRRREQLIKSTIYALEISATKNDAANFLDISIKGLQYRINTFPELKKYKYVLPCFMKGWSKEKVIGYIKANRGYLDDKTLDKYESNL